MTHIPGRLESIPLKDYPAFLERMKSEGKGITGSDKRVYDPRLNKFIPAIIYVKKIADESPVAGGLTGALSHESKSDTPASRSLELAEAQG